MKAKILMLVLTTVLVAGCVGIDIPGAGGLAVGAGNGLEIISFTAEPTTVYSGRTVRVVAEVENRGGTIVPDNSAIIYLTGSNIDLADTDGTYWYGRDIEDRAQIKLIPSMEPENVVRGTPADIERFDWSLTAPNLTPGQTRQDTFIVRVYNEYSSGVNGNIWVYTESEAEATKAAGRSLETSAFTPVQGPVGVSVRVNPNPVILYDGENEITFNIDITNNAQGTIYYNTGMVYSAAASLALSADDHLNRVNVIVEAPEFGDDMDCEGVQEIFGGRSLTLVCEATINSGKIPTTFKSYLVNVIVEYGYYTQREATVTVQGKA